MREEKDSLRNRNKGNKASSFHPTLDSSTLVFGDLFWGTYSARRPSLFGKDTEGAPFKLRLGGDFFPVSRTGSTNLDESTYLSPLNWWIFRRSRLDGLPCGAGLKIIPAFRS